MSHPRPLFKTVLEIGAATSVLQMVNTPVFPHTLVFQTGFATLAIASMVVRKMLDNLHQDRLENQVLEEVKKWGAPQEQKRAAALQSQTGPQIKRALTMGLLTIGSPVVVGLCVNGLSITTLALGVVGSVAYNFIPKNGKKMREEIKEMTSLRETIAVRRASPEDPHKKQWSF